MRLPPDPPRRTGQALDKGARGGVRFVPKCQTRRVDIILNPSATGGSDNVDGDKSTAADGVTSITAVYGDVTRPAKSVKYVIKSPSIRK